MNVRSVAYLDSSGALTQDAFFSSDIKVRGNQVISYLKELDGGQAIGRAELPLEKACDVWDAQEKREKGVVKISTRVKTSRQVSENAIPESKRTELTSLLDQILANEGFNVVHGDSPSTVTSPQNTAYMRHLVSDWALGPSADYEVNLELDLINTSTHIVPSVYSSHSMLYGPEVFYPILVLAIMCWNYQSLFRNPPRGVCSRRKPCRHHLLLSGIMLPVHGVSVIETE